MHLAAPAAHETADLNALKSIYAFGEWCHSRKVAAPEIWMAAYMHFYEHLVEHPATFAGIPDWLSPEVFEDCLPMFEERLEDVRYPFARPGAFAELLEMYDIRRGTSFLARIGEWK